MSSNAAISANNDAEPSDMLNTDHQFWQIIRTVPDFPKVGIDFMILRRYCAVILMRSSMHYLLLCQKGLLG